MFDSDYVRRQNWQLSNIKLIELNQKSDYVRLILISTKLLNRTLIELNQESDYVRLMLCLTNVMFNNGQKMYIYFVEHTKYKWLYYVRLHAHDLT